MTWPELPAGLIPVETEDALLLIDSASGTIHSLDPLWALVLRHRDLFHDRADAAGDLAEVFEVDHHTATASLEHLENLLSAASNEPRQEAFLKRRPRPPRRLEIPDHVVDVYGIDALGYGIRVVAHDDDLSAAVAPILEGFASNRSPGSTVDVWRDGPAIRIALDGGLMSTEFDTTTSMFRLAGLLTAVAADMSPSPILMHAAGVVIDGKAWLLVGRSNQGKSSTTVELMSRGANYLSDEIIALDPQRGVASGLARPIGLEGPYRAKHPQLAPDSAHAPSDDERWAVPPRRLGEVSASAPIGGIALIRYVQTSAAGRTLRLNVEDALSGLLPHLYRRSRLTQPLAQELSRLLGRIPTHAVFHDGAEDAARSVLSLARSHAL